MATFVAGIEAIRDETVPDMLRNLSGLLTRDPDTLTRLGEVAAGRPLEPGETVDFDLDQETVGRLLATVAEWSAASLDEKGAIKRTAGAAEAYANALRDKLGQLDQERRQRNSLGGQRGAQTRREKAAEWQVKAVERAKDLLANGAFSPRDVTGILAKQFRKNPSTVLRLLKKAGVK